MEPSGPRSDRPVLWTVTGSDGSDGSDSFNLKRHRPASFFFFSPKRRRSETAPTYFFFPSYTASFCLSESKSLFWNPHFSFLNHSQPSLVSNSLKSSHSQVSISPSRRRTVATHPLSLAPSHFALRSSASSSLSCRTSQLSLSPASPSQRSLDRSSLVAVATQPRYFIYGITNTKDSELQ